MVLLNIVVFCCLIGGGCPYPFVFFSSFVQWTCPFIPKILFIKKLWKLEILKIVYLDAIFNNDGASKCKHFKYPFWLLWWISYFIYQYSFWGVSLKAYGHQLEFDYFRECVSLKGRIRKKKFIKRVVKNIVKKTI